MEAGCPGWACKADGARHVPESTREMLHGEGSMENVRRLADGCMLHSWDESLRYSKGLAFEAHVKEKGNEKHNGIALL